MLVSALGAGGALGAGAGGLLFDSTFSNGNSGNNSGRLPRLSLALLAALQLAIAGSNVLRTCNVAMLAAAYFAQGCFTGAFRSGANSAILRLHSAETVAPFMQALHFFSGVGRFLASLLGPCPAVVCGANARTAWATPQAVRAAPAPRRAGVCNIE